MSLAPATVAIIYGGRSSEHAISCVSAGGVLAAIDRDRFDPVPIGITEKGQWVLQPDDPDSMRMRDGVLPTVDPGQPEVSLSFRDQQVGLDILLGTGRSWRPIDLVFPVLHGAHGEDGSIQGMLEFLGIPYVGCGVFASAACMDKGHTKALLGAVDIDVGEWTSFTADRWRSRPDEVLADLGELGLPVFVKPARAGSSQGITRVTSGQGLGPAIEEALAHDPRMIVEASVEDALEIECGVLHMADGSIRTSSCAQIVVHDEHEYYDFEAKYLDDSADLLVPAPIGDDLSGRLRDIAAGAFTLLGCEGLARVDFLVGRDGRAVLNEINTMPGFTPISMYPRMWAESGVGYTELIGALLDQGLQRGTGLR